MKKLHALSLAISALTLGLAATSALALTAEEQAQVNAAGQAAAQAVKQQASAQADALLTTAKAQGDALVAAAKEKGDALIAAAKAASYSDSAAKAAALAEAQLAKSNIVLDAQAQKDKLIADAKAQGAQISAQSTVDADAAKTTAKAITTFDIGHPWLKAGEPTEKVQFNSNGPAESIDPTYNVCRGIDPRCYHPWKGNIKNKILIYSRTAGPRHANLGPAQTTAGSVTGSANIPDANIYQKSVAKWMEEQGVTVTWTEDVNVLAGLSIGTYDALVMASPTRDTFTKHGTFVAEGAKGYTNLAGTAIGTGNNPGGNLSSSNLNTDQAKTSLRNFLRAGGGFAGMHNVFGAEYNWPYYEGLLGNANYMDHGSAQAGDIVIVNQADVSTAGLPKQFHFADEWYNFAPFPTKVRFLAAVDDNTLSTGRGGTNPGHSFHPVSWCQYYDGGKAWITSLGHFSNAFDPNASSNSNAAISATTQAYFKQHVVHGLLSIMGREPFCRGNDNRPDANGNVRDDKWFRPLQSAAQPQAGSWADVR
ncbi:ThuA domain-containing protein [Variovorax sp. J2P1-59]|uniref:ThuA domain-containing protein n=1 Tax=Variovorax flavidus TaxID=3053501 RepID=UPI0025777029|nr:ThuA domain-containing protein [Variovorax sp. J2P1-59]MDM0078165.1 ThuA domain-containing protein [Variovorax sp. J2P1-59]